MTMMMMMMPVRLSSVNPCQGLFTQHTRLMTPCSTISIQLLTFLSSILRVAEADGRRRWWWKSRVARSDVWRQAIEMSGRGRLLHTSFVCINGVISVGIITITEERETHLLLLRRFIETGNNTKAGAGEPAWDVAPRTNTLASFPPSKAPTLPSSLSFIHPLFNKEISRRPWFMHSPIVRLFLYMHLFSKWAIRVVEGPDYRSFQVDAKVSIWVAVWRKWYFISILVRGQRIHIKSVEVQNTHAPACAKYIHFITCDK